MAMRNGMKQLFNTIRGTQRSVVNPFGRTSLQQAGISRKTRCSSVNSSKTWIRCASSNEQSASLHNARIGWIGTGVMEFGMDGKSAVSLIELAVKKNLSFNSVQNLLPIHTLSLPTDTTCTLANMQSISDVVFTMLGYPKDVRSIILGDATQKGVIHGLKPGGIIVDMTTSEPSLAKEIYEEAKKKGIHSVDAPVSGGDVGAREARLSIMIGGDAPVVQQLTPLFAAMGKNIKHMGPAGAGQSTKMSNQILIATNMIGVVEGLLYAYKSGLDLNDVIAAVGGGAADPGFYVDHFVKDMEIALAEAKKMQLKLPGLELAHSLYKELQAQGHGKKGTHSLVLAFEKLNNITMKTT